LSQKSTTLSGKVKETAKQTKEEETRQQQQQLLILSSLSFSQVFWVLPTFFFFGWRNFGIVAKAKQSKSESVIL
jgi:hypothetical protein